MNKPGSGLSLEKQITGAIYSLLMAYIRNIMKKRELTQTEKDIILNISQCVADLEKHTKERSKKKMTKKATATKAKSNTKTKAKTKTAKKKTIKKAKPKQVTAYDRERDMACNF